MIEIAVGTFVVFAATMVVINRSLRIGEAAGDFDPQSPSSAARPGLRLFFDYSVNGWRFDGIRQRPVAREHVNRA
jgi:hypothetical protein